MSTAEIWNQFAERLRAFIYKRVQDDAIANDLLQDVFLKVHLNMATLRDDTRVLPWLYQITRNVVNDHFRQKAQTHQLLPDDLPADETDNTAGHLSNCLQVFVSRLPDTYREAITLSELEGVKQIDVAARLGLSHSGAKSRVQRGRQLLRDQFMACCHFQLTESGHLKGEMKPGECTICQQASGSAASEHCG